MTVIEALRRAHLHFLFLRRSAALVAFIRLIKQEIRGQLLVLVTGKVRLNHEIPFET